MKLNLTKNFKHQSADYKAGHLTTICLVFLLAIVSLPVAAGPQDDKEFTLKLAFIYNFAKFITWPEGVFKNEYDTLDICLSEFHDFDAAIDAFGSKKVGSRNVKFRDANSLEDFAICDIVYFDQDSNDQMSMGYDRKGLLAIGNAQGAHDKGSIINFFHDDSKLRFSIDVTNANKVGLSFNSRLLRLASLNTDD